MSETILAYRAERTPDPVVAPDKAEPYREVPDGTVIPQSQYLIRQECDDIKAILLDKNRKYGDSALTPLRVFSKADSIEQIRVRIDDKLSRILSGQKDDTEDVIVDLIGYLILLRVAIQQNKAATKEAP